MIERQHAKIRSPYASAKKNPNLPFHPAVRAGDFIFVSGQVPKDENNDMISRHDRGRDAGHAEDHRAHHRRRGRNALDIVRITTYLEDTRDFGRYNKAFLKGIGDAVLARTTVEAQAVMSTKIEMDADRLQAAPAQLRPSRHRLTIEETTCTSS